MRPLFRIVLGLSLKAAAALSAPESRAQDTGINPNLAPSTR